MNTTWDPRERLRITARKELERVAAARDLEQERDLARQVPREFARKTCAKCGNFLRGARSHLKSTATLCTACSKDPEPHVEPEDVQRDLG